MSGTLYVVATPLGNLGDLSPRAAETLRAVAVVAAEDTRRTRKLLNHVDATPRLVSLPAFAEESKATGVLEHLEAGADVALVSDAGTPGVSDPGARLVALAHDRGLTVVPIPGPAAVATALSVSGLPADRYLFVGFVARKGKARREALASAAAQPWTTVFYEAPTRLVALLEDLADTFGGDRIAVVCREMTKMHEEVVRGTLDGVRERFAAGDVRGEITVVVEGRAPVDEPPDLEAIAGEVADLRDQGRSTREIVRHLTENRGISRNEGYRLVTRTP
jgi:16S rRNA (cytidine1402-2'-O)-methyltransferase